MAVEPQPDHILIETSGLALPKPLLKAFDWPISAAASLSMASFPCMQKQLQLVSLRQILRVSRHSVLQMNLDHETLIEVFEDQSVVHIILLTKSDLADADQKQTAK